MLFRFNAHPIEFVPLLVESFGRLGKKRRLDSSTILVTLQLQTVAPPEIFLLVSFVRSSVALCVGVILACMIIL